MEPLYSLIYRPPHILLTYYIWVRNPLTESVDIYDNHHGLNPAAASFHPPTKNLPVSDPFLQGQKNSFQ